MPAPGFGKAFDQRQGLRFEKDDPQVGALCAQCVGNLRQLRKTRAAARIDGDGDAGVAFAGQVFDQCGCSIASGRLSTQ